MNIKNTIEILTKDIQEIENIVSNYKNYSQIPQIEIDRVLSRIRNLYDSLIVLKNTSTEPVTEDLEITSQTKSETEIEESVSAGKTEQPKDDKLIEVEEEKAIESTDDIKSPVEISQDLPTEKGKPVDIKKEPETLADLFRNSKSFRNEELAEKNPVRDLSEKLQSQPISDIGSAIGLNEKFLFINELFNGNSEKFEETIRYLNNAPNFNDAFNYLNEHFDWEMENPSVQKLLDLARRKLIINEDE
ncbi:MAG: hypothetical protein KAU83_06905 [Bacteroidales bacterium]|nr:hypothetical protein [Bacteroidales bacterium]